VQTGWGRTGEHFWGWQAHAQGGATPDIVTFAKGVGNGLSVGGVIARAEIMDSLKGNSISTFGGSPVTAAGALANLRYLLANDLQGNAAKVGPILLDGLLAAAPRGGQPPASPHPSWRAPCWRRRSGAGCWSARVACTGTRCASRRR
jgi:4-aminobutyrate aminotransferase